MLPTSQIPFNYLVYDHNIYYRRRTTIIIWKHVYMLNVWLYKLYIGMSLAQRSKKNWNHSLDLSFLKCTYLHVSENNVYDLFLEPYVTIKNIRVQFTNIFIHTDRTRDGQIIQSQRNLVCSENCFDVLVHRAVRYNSILNLKILSNYYRTLDTLFHNPQHST